MTPPAGVSRPLLIGTTSYVLPDDLLPNVRLLAGLVDDVELILFEGEYSNLPSPSVVEELGRLSQTTGTGYTVHLPLDVGLGALGAAERRRSVDVCRRVMDLTRELGPRAFVVHPEMPLAYHPELGEEPRRFETLPAELEGRWPRILFESLAALKEEATAAGVPLAVENLQFPYEWVWPGVDELGLGVTLDVGHLVKAGGAVPDFLERYGERLTVVHLHGVEDGRDHRQAGAWGRAGLRDLLARFRRTGPEDAAPLVVSLEVFGAEPTVPSLRAVADACEPEDPTEARRLRRAADAIAAAAGL